MALPIAETWTGTTGAAWPSPWTTAAQTGGSNTIQSNAGQQSPGTLASYLGGATAYYGAVGASDFEIYVDATFTNNESYPTVAFRTDGVPNSTYYFNNGLHVEIQSNSNFLSLYRLDSGVRTDIVAAFAVSGVTNWSTTASHFRIRCSGTNVKVRVWQGTVEPLVWNIDTTVTQHSTRQGVGLTISGGGAASQGPVTWDNLSVIVPTYVPYLVQTIGTNTAQAAGTTLSVNFSGTNKPQAGDWIVVSCVRDIVVADAPPTGDSISATPGSETYTRTPIESPANAASGAGVGIVGITFVAKVVSTWAGGTNTITWTMPSVTAKAIHIEHWSFVDSIRASSTASARNAAGAPSVTSGSLTSGDVAIARSFFENSSSQTVTADSDTTNGNWSTQFTQVASGSSTNATTARTFVKLTGQNKLTTGTATQTYNVTNSNTTSVNAAAIIFGFVPYVPPATSINLGNAASSWTANNLSSNNTKAIGQPGITLTGYGLTSPGRSLAQAAIAVAAYNLSLASQLGLTTASFSFAAFNLSLPTPLNLGLASFGLTAFNQSSSRTLNLATLGFTANDEALSSSRSLSLASLSFTANNESVTSSRSLGIADVGFTALNQSASRTFTTANFSWVANNESVSRTLGLASFNLTAYNLSRTLIQGLGVATFSWAAFDESLTQISNLPLGLASMALAASDLTPFILRSAGLAALTLTAGPLTALRPAQDATGAIATTAYPMSLGGRSVGLADLALTAYDVALLSDRSSDLASLTFGAFNMHLQPQITTRIKYTIMAMVVNEDRAVLVSNRSVDRSVTNTDIGALVNPSSVDSTVGNRDINGNVGI